MAYELIKVSQLPETTTPTDSDLLPIQSGDYLKKVTFENLKDAATGSVSQAITDEVTAREGAVSGEASTRSTADATLAGDLAAPYDATKTYALGAYCTKDLQTYRSNTAITTAEAWTAAHWDAVALGDDVGDLKSAFSDFSGYEKYTLTIGKYYATNGATVNIATPSSNNGWQSVVVPCSAGDKFYVTGSSGSSPRLWCFVNASESKTAATSLSVANASATGTNLEITAPTNATHLVCNMIYGDSYTAGLTKGMTFDSAVTQLNEKINDAVAIANGVFRTKALELACIIDANIYVDGYEKVAINYFWYNSPSHTDYETYISLKGYKDGAWEAIVGNFSRATAPIDRPDIEKISVDGVFDMLINWNLISSPYTSSYTDANRPVFKSCLFSELPIKQIASYEAQDNTKNIIIVASDGSGDYTTIGAAYAAITDSAFDNQYEVIIKKGSYSEQKLIPPPYTHTHGIKAEDTIVTSVGLEYDTTADDWLSVFDLQNTCKLSNMTIISGTKYCIHEDAYSLSRKMVKCENLILKQTKAHNNAIVGDGTQFGGTKYIFNNCTFINGSVTTHSNTRAEAGANQHTILNSCKFVDASVTLSSVGTTLESIIGQYIFEINNCVFNPQNGTIVLRFGSPITGLNAPNFPWILCGSGNEGIDITFDNTNDTTYSDAWDSVNLIEKTFIKVAASVTKGQYVDASGVVTTVDANKYGKVLADTSANDYAPIYKVS